MSLKRGSIYSTIEKGFLQEKGWGPLKVHFQYTKPCSFLFGRLVFAACMISNDRGLLGSEKTNE